MVGAVAARWVLTAVFAAAGLGAVLVNGEEREQFLADQNLAKIIPRAYLSAALDEGRTEVVECG